MIIDKYTNSSVRQHTTLEGTSFSNRGGARNKQRPTNDKYIVKKCNASDAYRKFTQHHIVQKQLPIKRVQKKGWQKQI